MDKFKRNVAWVLKISAAMATTVLMVWLVVAVVNAGIERSEKRKLAPLAEVKIWNTIKAGHMRAEFNLITKWEGQLDYQIYVNFEKGSLPAELSSLTFEFYDKNGFSLFEKIIDGSSLTRTISGSDGYSGYMYKGHELVSAEDYKKASRWDVSWRH